MSPVRDNTTAIGHDSETAFDYFYFDHELDLTARLLVTDKTRVIVNFEIRDENWLNTGTDGTAHQDGRALDDNIEFKRVFSSHTFDAYGTVLDLGLMTGAAWGTSFGDTATGKYRIKVTQPTELGPVIAIYEKNHEEGSENNLVEDAEKDDAQGVALAMVTKLGDVNIMPLIQYVDDSSAVLDRGSDGVDVLVFALAATGTFGDIGFESEFVVKDYDKSDFDATNTANFEIGDDEDYTIWGLYGNGWWNIGAGKVGLLAAYGNWDEDSGQGYNMGDDFEPVLFAANQADVGGGIGEFYGVSVVQLYGSLALSEELSINGSGLYWASNAKEDADGSDNFWRDSDGYEINAGLAWKLTDQVTYSAAAAFGKWSLDSNDKNDAAGDSPDGFVRAYHKFQIDF